MNGRFHRGSRAPDPGGHFVAELVDVHAGQRCGDDREESSIVSFAIAS